MLHRFAAAAATAQRSNGGGCTAHHRRMPHSAAVAAAAAQRRCRVVAQHVAIFSMLPRFTAQRLQVGALKKCMGRAGPGRGRGGMGGPGRDGEGQLLNSTVVEALAGVCESEPEIELGMLFGISDPPNQLNRNIENDVVCYIAYDMKPRTYYVLPKTYDAAYDK